MSVIQASYRFPVPGKGEGYEDLIEHIKQNVREEFGLELIKALTERGGIVGPIHEAESRQEDWLWRSDTTEITYTIYAKLTDMPEPEYYRMMGGPADGMIQMTGGAAFWSIPYLPPISPSHPFDIASRAQQHQADYEREGDTQVYIFKGIR